jgi:uncharacterized protein YegP (UPF0339 family)
MGTFAIFKDYRGNWHYRLLDYEGNVLLSNITSYASKRNVGRLEEFIMKNALGRKNFKASSRRHYFFWKRHSIYIFNSKGRRLGVSPEYKTRGEAVDCMAGIVSIASLWAIK